MARRHDAAYGVSGTHIREAYRKPPAPVLPAGFVTAFDLAQGACLPRPALACTSATFGAITDPNETRRDEVRVAIAEDTH